MRIGIFGGSFNPVHNGHLKLARAAMSELNLSSVFFVPARVTPLKEKNGLLPARVRECLLKKAVRKIPGFSVSSCEIGRKGPSFTVDTLRIFKKRYGRGAVLYFLAGADTLNTLSRWKSPKKIFKLCRFIVMTRPGYRAKKLNAPVLWLPFDALDVSATKLRRCAAKGSNLKALVPDGTEKVLRHYFKKTGRKGGAPSK